MASLLDKARIAFLSIAHGILDRVIDMNSIGAVKQHVRDLEESIGGTETAVAETSGDIRSARRKADAATSANAALDRQIDAILSDDDPNNDHHAASLQARFDTNTNLAAIHLQNVTSLEGTRAQLEEVLSALRTKHAQMIGRIAELEALDQQADRTESATAAIRSVSRLDSEGADASIDSVAERIRNRNDRAAAGLSQALGTVAASPELSEARAGVEARLAERRARLAASKGAGEQSVKEESAPVGQ